MWAKSYLGCLVLAFAVFGGAVGAASAATIEREIVPTLSEHGFWWDDYDLSYRTYDRWVFDMSDVALALGGESVLEVVIRMPTGQRLLITQPSTLTVSASLYHGHWDDDFVWPLPLEGQMLLAGTNCPAVEAVDPLCESNGGEHRQMQWYALTEQSGATWELTEIRLTMDVSSFDDPLKLYSMSGDPWVWNDITFSRLVDGPEDPGVFTQMIPEPASMSLLALSALALLRRRTA